MHTNDILSAYNPFFLEHILVLTNFGFQVGLQTGDQLLEVCGINMRNATYDLAANVLRQCGNSITMLVQYSPDSKCFLNFLTFTQINNSLF